MTDQPDIAARDLDWPGALNARDLGGLPTKDGGVTRRGVLVRTDLLNRYTPEGLAALRAYGVRTVIDLRTPRELERRPSPIASGADGLRYLHLSLEGEDPEVMARMRAATTREEDYILILDHFGPQVATVMRAIAAHSGAHSGGHGDAHGDGQRDGALAFHCHAGKDRTGIVAGMLLELAGVPDELIAADYAHSETTAYAAYDVLVAENGGRPLAPRELETPAASMQAMLDHLRATYGGVAAYLRWAGLTAAEIASLRALLREC